MEEIRLFVDDAKLLRNVKSKEKYDFLKKGMDTICEWSQRWEIEFSAKNAE